MPIWTRGRPRLIYEVDTGDLRCTACGACALACPVDVIKIEQHPSPVEGKILDRFDIDMAGCIECALCVEACPFRAITMAPDFEMAATYDRAGLAGVRHVRAAHRRHARDRRGDGAHPGRQARPGGQAAPAAARPPRHASRQPRQAAGAAAPAAAAGATAAASTSAGRARLRPQAAAAGAGRERRGAAPPPRAAAPAAPATAPRLPADSPLATATAAGKGMPPGRAKVGRSARWLPPARPRRDQRVGRHVSSADRLLRARRFYVLGRRWRMHRRGRHGGRRRNMIRARCWLVLVPRRRGDDVRAARRRLPGGRAAGGLRRRDHGADHLRHLDDPGPDRPARPGSASGPAASARCSSSLGCWRDLGSGWSSTHTAGNATRRPLDMCRPPRPSAG